jgi:FAD/FMN-containing dehydrogenase
MSTTLPIHEDAAPRAAALDELRATVSGRLVTPADADYDRARTPWAVNIDQRPAAVLEVADTTDVVTAVRWAIRHGYAVTAQPTGHSGRRAVDDTLLLRTRGLDRLEVDVRAGTATVGAGVKFGELTAALDGTGLMALAGSNGDPTVVGLSLGGGVSWFTRKHGFTANSIVSLDVVDADGERRAVDAESDPELFWALRGGGGDFAIVLAVTLRLFAAPEMYGGQLAWPIEHAPSVLRAFRDLALVAPRELTLWAHVMHLPDLEMVPEPLRGRSVVTVAATYLGTAEMAERLLWSLRAAAPVEIELMTPFQPSGLGDVTAEPNDPMPVREHSQLLVDLDDEAIDDLLAVAGTPASGLAVVQVRGLGGAFADAGEANGAVRPVTETFNVFALGAPAGPEIEPLVEGSFAELDLALGRLATGRTMPNFGGVHQPVADGFDATRLARLRQIKRDRDPRGTIRSNKPVLG